MSEISSYLLFAMSALFALYMLRMCQPRLAPLLGGVCILGLALCSVSLFGGLYSELSSVLEGLGLSDTSHSVMRILGVGYTFGLCSELCRELGEVGLAEGVQTLGRVEILVLSAPAFREIIGLFGGML